jgi:hypothetical protein
MRVKDITYFPFILSHPTTLPCTPAVIGLRHSQATIRLPCRTDFARRDQQGLNLGPLVTSINNAGEKNGGVAEAEVQAISGSGGDGAVHAVRLVGRLRLACT